ncbi:MAG: hypothetical protein RSB77_04560 [Bacilli bacterium]
MKEYPKSVKELHIRNEYLLTILNKVNKTCLTKWTIWYKGLNINMNLHLKENEYLKASYKEPNHFALQVWIHKNDLDVVKYNLVSNFDSPFNESNTVIIKSK